MLKRLWVAVCRSLCNVGKMGWTIEGLFEASIQYVDYTVCICSWVSMCILPTSHRKRMKKGTKIEQLVQGQCFHWCSHPTRYWKFARLKRTRMGWLEFCHLFFDLNLKFCASTLSFVLFLGGAIPVFNRMLNGTDCDQNWSWHVAWPGKVIWRDVTNSFPRVG